MNINLIVPVAKDTGDSFPFLFTFDKKGVLLCIKSIMGLEINRFTNIYFTVLKKIDNRFNVKTLLELQFKQLGLKNARVVLLDAPTKSEPETLYQTIKQENIKGSCFIKDADSYFKCEIPNQNGLAIFSLEDVDFMVSLKDKSFVFVDDNFYITNTIEKKIISKYINIGGYYFQNIQDFCFYFEKIGNQKGLYLSHIVYAMLLDKKLFRPIECYGYQDFDMLSLNF